MRHPADEGTSSDASIAGAAETIPKPAKRRAPRPTKNQRSTQTEQRTRPRRHPPVATSRGRAVIEVVASRARPRACAKTSPEADARSPTHRSRREAEAQAADAALAPRLAIDAGGASPRCDSLRACPSTTTLIDARALDAGALQRWTAAIVERLGTPPDIAADVAEVLLASDRRGIASHGTARLPQYVALVDAGVMDPAARPGHRA